MSTACSPHSFDRSPAELWGIVANAGVTNYGEIEWMSFDELKWLVNVNLTGTLRFVKEGIPYLRKSRGRVVIMSGVQGD